MESFEALEKKIGQLISVVHALKAENAGLKKKLGSLEKDITEGNTNIHNLNQEREKTKHLVAGLIKNIDQLVANS
jgi:FtsZ-binding cell division protein ZapB